MSLAGGHARPLLDIRRDTDPRYRYKSVVVLPHHSAKRCRTTLPKEIDGRPASLSKIPTYTCGKWMYVFCATSHNPTMGNCSENKASRQVCAYTLVGVVPISCGTIYGLPITYKAHPTRVCLTPELTTDGWQSSSRLVM